MPHEVPAVSQDRADFTANEDKLKKLSNEYGETAGYVRQMKLEEEIAPLEAENVILHDKARTEATDINNEMRERELLQQHKKEESEKLETMGKVPLGQLSVEQIEAYLSTRKYAEMAEKQMDEAHKAANWENKQRDHVEAIKVNDDFNKANAIAGDIKNGTIGGTEKPPAEGN